MGGTASPAGLVKAGVGSVVLSGASTFTGGVQVNGGISDCRCASSAWSRYTHSGRWIRRHQHRGTGPLGVGALSMVGGTTLQSGTAVRTLFNAVNLTGDITFGGPNAVNGVISPAMNLGSGRARWRSQARWIFTTISGPISGSGTGLTKAGNGIPKLSWIRVTNYAGTDHGLRAACSRWVRLTRCH